MPFSKEVWLPNPFLGNWFKFQDFRPLLGRMFVGIRSTCCLQIVNNLPTNCQWFCPEITHLQNLSTFSPNIPHKLSINRNVKRINSGTVDASVDCNLSVVTGTRNTFYKGQGDFQLVCPLEKLPKWSSFVPSMSPNFLGLLWELYFVLGHTKEYGHTHAYFSCRS